MPRRRNRRSRQSSPPRIPCKYCDKSAVKLLECSICNRNLYCSIECQLDDWINHKTECDGRTNELKMEKRTERTHNKETPVFPVSEKGGECYSCGKSGVKLHKCSKCHEVKYCSVKCQKADWPSHKVDCEKNGKIPAENSEGKCYSCGKSGVKLQKCSKCHEVKYCSVKCQKADWPSHKVDCEKNGKIPAENSEKECDFCCKSGIKLQKCSRCHEVMYCSKKCQKADWANHKVNCQKADLPDQNVDCEKNGKISVENSEKECDFCCKSGIKLQKCSRCHKVNYCSKKCQKADWPNHKINCENDDFIKISTKNSESMCRRCLRICKSTYCDVCVREYILCEVIVKCALKKCCQLAKSMYLGFEVITKFSHIQRSSYFPFLPDQVLVVLMNREGFHWFRPSIQVMDEDGDEFRLIFYLKESMENSLFPWHMFKPGNFICIPFPEIHLFLDGTIGFRLEKTTNIRILRGTT